ncbi:MAG: glycosyltransferase [Acetobacter sp.]|nr:glycosyltransferase [Bacteroides sp.]MCM1341562.1 glycosyltransferase [Acetobacter sp.]MCM1433639.1 glycosyltransferase [Clostridiales bacterium]
MQNSLISIIVPVYNVEKYLDKCIESIVNQTYKNLEIILVDNGSFDNCPKICDEWAKKDSRIKVIHQKENKGAASARNAGMAVASGNYIGFTDSDDYIEANMYEFLLKQLIEADADISVCDYQVNDESSGEANSKNITAEEALKLILIGDYKYGVIWNKLYKKEIVKNIQMPNLQCCEDLVYNYYAFKNSNIIVESNFKLYHYFQHENSIVHSEFNKGSLDAVVSKEIMMNDVTDKEFLPYAVRGYVSSCFVVLSGIINSGKFYDEFENLRKGILKYKKEILFSNMYTKRDKIKVIILFMSSNLYRKLVKFD